MKLTQRDIQYVMNEARRIVAEKQGQVDENVFARVGQMIRKRLNNDTTQQQQKKKPVGLDSRIPNGGTASDRAPMQAAQ